jgi:osmotically-inducible protein OsmY
MKSTAPAFIASTASGTSPIVRDGEVVGIVSRANLLQGLLACEPQPGDDTAGDASLRARVCEELDQHSWAYDVSNVVAENGVVHLWGNATSVPAKDAVRVAVENVPGVRRVVNKIVVRPVDALLPS